MLILFGLLNKVLEGSIIEKFAKNLHNASVQGFNWFPNITQKLQYCNTISIGNRQLLYCVPFWYQTKSKNANFYVE